MPSIKAVLFIIIVFCCLCSTGQVNAPKNDNELDKKYSPDKNSVFNELQKNKQSSSSVLKNSIKFCPTLLVREKFGFYFERSIFKGASLYIGGGKAFGSDFIQSTAFALASGFSITDVLSASDILLYSKYDNSSAFLCAGAKLYFSGKAFEDGYLSFNFMNESMDYMLNQRIYDMNVQGPRLATFEMNSFNVGWGYVFAGGRKNNIIHEFYANAGIKLFNISRFQRVEFNPPVGSSVGYYYKTAGDLQVSLPSFNMGYILGLAF